jgi:hypothetical protein
MFEDDLVLGGFYEGAGTGVLEIHAVNIFFEGFDLVPISGHGKNLFSLFRENQSRSGESGESSGLIMGATTQEERILIGKHPLIIFPLPRLAHRAEGLPLKRSLSHLRGEDKFKVVHHKLALS